MVIRLHPDLLHLTPAEKLLLSEELRMEAVLESETDATFADTVRQNTQSRPLDRDESFCLQEQQQLEDIQWALDLSHKKP